MPIPRQLGVAWDWIRIEGAAGGAVDVGGDGAIEIPVGTRVDYFLDLPGAAELAVSEVQAELGADRLDVTVAHESGARGQGSFATGGSAALPVDGPGLVRISLAPAGAAGGRVRIMNAALRLDGGDAGRPAVQEAAVGPATSLAQPPNVLVFLVDTLRADHLGCYGYGRDTSPALDAFASEATLFENALAQAPWTRPSVASLFTGMTPVAHGVNGSDSSLPEEALTLAELFDSAGYDTLGIVTNPNVAEQLGFDQGFADFRLTEERNSSAHHVVDLFSQWLEGRSAATQPFFAYLHTGEPHGPYTPPAHLRDHFGPVGSEVVGRAGNLELLASGELEADAAHIEDLQRLYDAEILWSDESFGRLVEELRGRRLLEDTVVVFLSDHGEAFSEHGSWQHGKVLYREVIGVPLVIRGPGFEAGRRVADLVQHVDLYPTLVALAGLEPPPSAPRPGPADGGWGSRGPARDPEYGRACRRASIGRPFDGGVAVTRALLCLFRPRPRALSLDPGSPGGDRPGRRGADSGRLSARQAGQAQGAGRGEHGDPGDRA